MAQVYVLDDCPVIQQGAKSALSSLGQVTATALWSEISIPLVTAKDAAVLVCDLDMPGIDGAQFCAIVRRFNPTVRIVIFTSSPERAPRALADCVVGKREGLTQLRRCVEGLLAEGVGTC